MNRADPLPTRSAPMATPITGTVITYALGLAAEPLKSTVRIAGDTHV